MQNNSHCQFTIPTLYPQYFTPHAHVQAFSFLSLFLFVGMIGYFFVARYLLKWSTHGETGGSSHSVTGGDKSASQDEADGPDDD